MIFRFQRKNIKLYLRHTCDPGASSRCSAPGKIEVMKIPYESSNWCDSHKEITIPPPTAEIEWFNFEDCEFDDIGFESPSSTRYEITVAGNKKLHIKNVLLNSFDILTNCNDQSDAKTIEMFSEGKNTIAGTQANFKIIPKPRRMCTKNGMVVPTGPNSVVIQMDFPKNIFDPQKSCKFEVRALMDISYKDENKNFSEKQIFTNEKQLFENPSVFKEDGVAVPNKMNVMKAGTVTKMKLDSESLQSLPKTIFTILAIILM
ncbi:hypothetical protein MHBO_000245 [Bonamia ostreae]|uniref:Uncharacterized protein n=1 Tax=Bonamia ostreae TaxID=126728 RepID=A0ABV2AG78_9EUKA